MFGGADSGEELGGGLVAQGLLGVEVIVDVCPSTQRRLQRRQVEVAVVALPELAAAGAVGAPDAAVELGGARGQHEEPNRSFLTGRFKLGHALAAADDLDRPQREEEPRIQYGEEVVQCRR